MPTPGDQECQDSIEAEGRQKEARQSESTHQGGAEAGLGEGPGNAGLHGLESGEADVRIHLLSVPAAEPPPWTGDPHPRSGPGVGVQTGETVWRRCRR